ncbi:MAG: hypothetical protein MHM6MM_003573 [Cercozoa sp. M6MM]
MEHCGFLEQWDARGNRWQEHWFVLCRSGVLRRHSALDKSDRYTKSFCVDDCYAKLVRVGERRWFELAPELVEFEQRSEKEVENERKLRKFARTFVHAPGASSSTSSSDTETPTIERPLEGNYSNSLLMEVRSRDGDVLTFRTRSSSARIQWLRAFRSYHDRLNDNIDAFDDIIGATAQKETMEVEHLVNTLLTDVRQFLRVEKLRRQFSTWMIKERRPEFPVQDRLLLDNSSVMSNISFGNSTPLSRFSSVDDCSSDSAFSISAPTTPGQRGRRLSSLFGSPSLNTTGNASSVIDDDAVAWRSRIRFVVSVDKLYLRTQRHDLSSLRQRQRRFVDGVSELRERFLSPTHARFFVHISPARVDAVVKWIRLQRRRHDRIPKSEFFVCEPLNEALLECIDSLRPHVDAFGDTDQFAQCTLELSHLHLLQQ